MGIVTWASMRCELLPSLEEPFVLGASQLEPLLELAYWLIRLRMANECFILNSTNLAAIFAQDLPNGYQNLKASSAPLDSLLHRSRLRILTGGKGRLPT